MPLVILEGSDGTGKTTLAKQLLKATGFHTLMVSRSGPPDDPDTFRRTTDWIWDGAHFFNILCDRHPIISECIYAPILRNEEPLISPNDIVIHLRSVPTLIVYCRPSFETIRNAIQSERQLSGVPEKLNEIVSAYDELMRALRMRGADLISYDFKDPDDADIVYRVTRFFNLHARNKG